MMRRARPADGAAATDVNLSGGLDVGQLARLREALVAAHPDAVPELIAGDDFDALLGSVAGARAAFARVREETARAAVGSVPRGGSTREINPAVFAGLSPEGKIARGCGGDNEGITAETQRRRVPQRREQFNAENAEGKERAETRKGRNRRHGDTEDARRDGRERVSVLVGRWCWWGGWTPPRRLRAATLP